jgi:hypothetical protein
MNSTDLRCYYCRQFEGKDAPAHVTLHDKRGCLHVCMEHARWRFTTSWAFGHSPDCPFHKNKKETET